MNKPWMLGEFDFSDEDTRDMALVAILAGIEEQRARLSSRDFPEYRHGDPVYVVGGVPFVWHGAGLNVVENGVLRHPFKDELPKGLGYRITGGRRTQIIGCGPLPDQVVLLPRTTDPLSRAAQGHTPKTLAELADG